MPLDAAHDWSRRTSPSALPEWMDEQCDRSELQACLKDLAWVNRVLFGYRPILQWLTDLKLSSSATTVRILDVGCGFGDTLREVERWAARRDLPVELTGLDLSPDSVAIARDASGSESRIRWVAGNVFDYAPEPRTHLVISSLMTHHLEDAEIVRLLGWMEENTLWGWAINDLSRHPRPARLFGWFADLFRLHRFVRHDGRVSFARAFTSGDWRRYCDAAGLPEGSVEIRGFTPGRLRVSRRKPQ